MFDNNTVCVVDSKSSTIGILDIGTLGGIGIALVIVVIAVIGFIIRVLFLYYLTYEAPKERPLNTLMYHDQVRPISHCILTDSAKQFQRDSQGTNND